MRLKSVERYVYKVGLLIIFLTQAAWADLASVPAAWQKLQVDVRFQQQQLQSAQIRLYDAPGQAPQTLSHSVKPAPAYLRDALFAPSTANPFRSAFAPLYQAAQRLNTCPFVAVQIEVDHQAATQEWYLATAAEYCLQGQQAVLAQGTDFSAHVWLLQRLSNGRFRVLMQSTGALTVDASGTTQGYKALQTRIFNPHVIRSNGSHTQPVCGFGVIDWRYQQGRYQPIKLYPIVSTCERHYQALLRPEETQAQFLARMKPLVKHYVLQWLRQATGRASVL